MSSCSISLRNLRQFLSHTRLPAQVSFCLEWAWKVDELEEKKAVVLVSEWSRRVETSM
jgi:hypothetical protein